MANAREVVIVSGARTAIGDYGGTLKDIPPTELGARVVREALRARRSIPATVGQCVFGNVIHTERRTCTCRASPPSTAGCRTKAAR